MSAVKPKGGKRKKSTKVWFARCRAAVWGVLTPCALLWWPDSVAFVIIASMYANVVSDLSVAEAADDTKVLDRLDRLEKLLTESNARADRLERLLIAATGANSCDPGGMPTNEPTADQLAEGGWSKLDDEGAEDLDAALDDADLTEGARLKISRDCTPEDLAPFLNDGGDETDEQRIERAAALLASLQEKGAEVTFAVSTVLPGGDLAGLIMGPPGSRGFLRRPDDAAVGESAGS